MRYILIFFLCIHSPLFLSAQLDSNRIQPKRGIYKTAVQFHQNSPIVIGFNVFPEGKEIDSKMKFIFIARAEVRNFSVYFVKSLNNKKIKEARMAWGFCDDEKIYVRSRYCSRGTYFVPLLYVGRYCYFIDYKGPSAGAPIMGPSGAMAGGSTIPAKLVEYYMDINTGMAYKLNHSVLQRLLKKDPELLKIYMDDEDRKDNRLYYLKEYSEKYKEEIKKNIMIKTSFVD